MSTQRYFLICRITATIVLVLPGLYRAYTESMSTGALNGACAGIILYAIWFARERGSK